MPPVAFSPLGRAHVLPYKLRLSKRLRPYWTGLFEHSRNFSSYGTRVFSCGSVGKTYNNSTASWLEHAGNAHPSGEGFHFFGHQLFRLSQGFIGCGDD